MLERYDPVAILETLNRHGVAYVVIGGFAATAYGSPLPTVDVDVTPEPSRENLARLSCALTDLEARVRVDGIPDGLVFSHSVKSLAATSVLNLITRFGELDVVRRPAGTTYESLASHALVVRLHDVDVPLAALSDVIESKQAANRPKDRQALPILRVLEERSAREQRDKVQGER
ncbi:MAG: hypothetical protein WCF24_11700 [Acidimicrobiales bacterium]